MTKRDVIDYFRYFSILTNHLEEVRRFIEFDHKNSMTFSMELAKLLSLSTGEIGTIMLGLGDMKAEYKDISIEHLDEARQKIISKYPKLEETIIGVDYADIQLTPWKGLSKDLPRWWYDASDVSKGRVANMEKANLMNVLNSMAAHLVLLMYMFYDVTGELESGLSSSRVCVFNSESLLDESGRVKGMLPDFMRID